MKNTCKKLLAAALALLLVVCCLPVTKTQAATKPKLSATSKSMYAGDKVTLKVKNQPKGSTVTWTSSKKSVATVSKKGVVKAVKAGSTTVTCKVKTKATKTAKAKTYTLKCKVTVKGTSKTVSTQSALKSALKNKKLTKITIKTDAARTFTVPAGTYSKVALVVDAANADVVNNGVFKSITVKSIKPETFTEKAKGNKITVSAPNARLIVDEGAELSGVTVTEANANVAIVVKGSVDTVAVNAAATVSVQADGDVGAVNVEAAAALNITGTAKEIAVTITADAAGATLTTAVTVKVESAANAKIELTAGAEGSTVKTTDTSASVDVKNDTTAKVDVTTPAGTQSVDAGREQTVTDSTSGGNTPSNPPSNTPSTPSGGNTPSNPSTSSFTVTISVTSGATTVTSGGSVTMTATTSSNESGLRYQWYQVQKGVDDIPLGTGESHTIIYGGDDAGDYYCVVTDANGNTGKSNIIAISPSIILSAEVNADGSVTLTATVIGVDDPTLSWSESAVANDAESFSWDLNPDSIVVDGMTCTINSPEAGEHYYYCSIPGYVGDSNVVTVTVPKK